MSFAKRRGIVSAAAAGLVALLATGAAYAAGVFDDPDHGPVIETTAGPVAIVEYPGWSYAAATSATGTACIVLTTPFGNGRTCAVPGGDTGMLSAGFVVDEATGKRYGFVMGFAQPDAPTLASFSDGTSRVNLSSPEGVYFVAVTPDDIEQGVLPVSVADVSGLKLAASLPREAFEAGMPTS